MSRTYSNFILFEDVLDNIPDSSVIMSQAVSLLLNPIIKIVEEDCATLLGRQVEASLELEGYVEVATGDVLTHDRQVELLSEGKYRYGIKTLDTCISHTKGGVCQKCFGSSFIGETIPQIGTSVAVPASIIYQTDIIRGDGINARFTLSQTQDDWYSLKVLKGGVLVDPSQYTLGSDYIEFPTIPAVSPPDIYTVHFLKQNTEPFLGYIAKTYSGGLLGMQPLPTIDPLLRVSLYETQFSDSFISLMMSQLNTLKAIPSTYLDYLDKIATRLEKVLLMLYLYAIYANVEV